MNSKPEQLRFHAIDGLTVRGDFEGGALSGDFGTILLRETESQIGLIDRITAAIKDRRHPSYIEYSMNDLLTQRIFQVACGYEDANDSNSLRHDPMFKLGVGRRPLDADQNLAHASTFTRLGQSLSRTDLYRIAQAFLEHFVASYAAPPKVIVLDLDHNATGHRHPVSSNDNFVVQTKYRVTIRQGLSG